MSSNNAFKDTIIQKLQEYKLPIVIDNYIKDAFLCIYYSLDNKESNDISIHLVYKEEPLDTDHVYFEDREWFTNTNDESFDLIRFDTIDGYFLVIDSDIIYSSDSEKSLYDKRLPYEITESYIEDNNIFVKLNCTINDVLSFVNNMEKDYVYEYIGEIGLHVLYDPITYKTITYIQEDRGKAYDRKYIELCIKGIPIDKYPELEYLSNLYNVYIHKYHNISFVFHNERLIYIIHRDSIGCKPADVINTSNILHFGYIPMDVIIDPKLYENIDVDDIPELLLNLKEPFDELKEYIKIEDTDRTLNIKAQYHIEMLKAGHPYFMNHTKLDDLVISILNNNNIQFQKGTFKTRLQHHGGLFYGTFSQNSNDKYGLDYKFNLEIGIDMDTSVLKHCKRAKEYETGCCSQRECEKYDIEVDVIFLKSNHNVDTSIKHNIVRTNDIVALDKDISTKRKISTFSDLMGIDPILSIDEIDSIDFD